ncbi:MAG TPA: hypothetical protein VM942_07760 [Acidimicrobiales bacterium]|nr:hypothetical protein [Acidimicrobiales bacterium]
MSPEAGVSPVSAAVGATPRGRPRLRSLLGAAFALLVLGAACSGGDEGVAGQLAVDGRAEVSTPDEATEEVTGSRSVKFGQGVKVLEGTAVLTLDRDRELELRAGSSVVLQEVEEGDRRVAQPLLLEQDILVQAPPGARLTVVTEGADVTVSGGAQVSRGSVLVVSSYDGTVGLRSGDQTSTVPALREVTIPAGEPPRRSPLTYDPDDAWDRRFLSDSFELGNELEARSKGFGAQVSPGDGLTPEFLLRLLPDLGGEPEFTPALFDAKRAPGESLVGAAIVLEGSRGTFAERWAAVFGFRDEGAQWGLVTLDQGVTRQPLLASVDAAISRGLRPIEPTPVPGSTGGGGNGGVAQPSPPSGGSAGSAGSGGTPATPGPAASPTVPAPTAPTTIPPVGPLNTGIPILDETINALVETLSGLLRGLGGG